MPPPNRPARIAFIATGLRLGGAEKMLHKLLLSLDRKKFQPSVFSLLGEGPVADEIRALDIPVHTRPSASPLNMLGLIRDARKGNFDLLQGWMYHGNLAAWLCRTAAPKRPPLVWNVRASLDDTSTLPLSTRLVVRLGGWLSGSPEAVLFNSARSMAQHIESAGYHATPCAVIENGFDGNVFSPDHADRITTRSGLGIPEQAPVVGLIARYHPMKDHATFLEAAARLLHERPDARFILAGTGVDASNQTLMHDIRRLKVQHAVLLLGPRENTVSIYRAMDICALSSSGVEGFPNVIGEAMACGVPCTVTNVGDSARIVGDTGIVVPPKDPAALANAWRTLFDAGAAARARMGEAARKRILDNYSLGAIARQYETLYLTLLKKEGFV